MKLNHKNTFWGSVTALIIGSSCCWISSVAIWIGGATVATTVGSFLGSLQSVLIFVGLLLGGISLRMYYVKRVSKSD